LAGACHEIVALCADPAVAETLCGEPGAAPAIVTAAESPDALGPWEFTATTENVY
jgi:hypothetical protein